MEYFDVLNEHGEYTGKTASRLDTHAQGLWHKAVVLFIINKDKGILLQKRSEKKKMWPGLWDITSGGHILEGEFGYECVIRETKEELGIDINLKDILFIGATTSNVEKGDIIDNHYNEYYIAYSDIDIKDITLDYEEVSDIKWFSKEEIEKRIKNNYDGLTTKYGVWNYLIKFLDKKA